MGGVFNALLTYLKEKSLLRVFADACLLIFVTTWLAFIYMVATNLSLKEIRTFLHPDHVQVADVLIVENQLQTEADHLLKLGNADRAIISRFHNGRKDINGIHFIYLSRFIEADAPGIKSALLQNQNTPVNLILSRVNQLNAGQCWEVYNTETKKPEPGTVLFGMLREQGMTSMIRCPVFNYNNELIGTVGLEWDRKELHDNEIDLAMRNIKETALRVTAILQIAAAKNQ